MYFNVYSTLEVLSYKQQLIIEVLLKVSNHRELVKTLNLPQVLVSHLILWEPNTKSLVNQEQFRESQFSSSASI